MLGYVDTVDTCDAGESKTETVTSLTETKNYHQHQHPSDTGAPPLQLVLSPHGHKTAANTEQSIDWRDNIIALLRFSNIMDNPIIIIDCKKLISSVLSHLLNVPLAQTE